MVLFVIACVYACMCVYLFMCIGCCRCYQFVGGPTFTDLFASVKHKSQSYNEIRGGTQCVVGKRSKQCRDVVGPAAVAVVMVVGDVEVGIRWSSYSTMPVAAFVL